MEAGERVFVNSHMSRANHLWRLWEKIPEVLVIFQGPHTYVSPTWYDHVNVPTWNYQSVHMSGRAQIIRDPEETHGILKRLIDRYEARGSYRLETLPEAFVEKEMKGLVAFQIEVTQIEANYKLSQNRDDANYRSIVAHLEARPDDLSHGVARAMRENRPSAL